MYGTASDGSETIRKGNRNTRKPISKTRVEYINTSRRRVTTFSTTTPTAVRHRSVYSRYFQSQLKMKIENRFIFVFQRTTWHNQERCSRLEYSLSRSNGITFFFRTAVPLNIARQRSYTVFRDFALSGRRRTRR